LIIDLGKSKGVTFVGALLRWDEDGNPRKPIDRKAKIGAPEVAATAKPQSGNRWLFQKLPPGRYDLVILANDRVRVEGFHYPPVAEFDPFLPADATVPDDIREQIVKDIAKSQHYENKVAPLYLAGDEKQVRILMQLVRDQSTSYDAEYGMPVATVRHEVWQYSNQYGGWVKDKKTKIFDRILLPRKDLHRWTWLWEPKLGGIQMKQKTVSLFYELPGQIDRERSNGWLPQ